MNNKAAEAVRRVYKLIPFKRSVFIFLRHIWVPPCWLYEHLYFAGPFDALTPDSRFRMVNYDCNLETLVFWRGIYGYERSSMKIWTGLCKESRVVLDIGANTGLFSLVAKATNPCAQVYAFEPIPRIYARLVRNSDLNHFGINCMNLAISDTDSEGVIYDLPLNHHHHASLIKTEAAHAGTVLIPVTIKRKRLDTILKEEQIDHIDLMKIDVEGHEPEVLEGLGSCLSRMRPSMLVEIKRMEMAKRIEVLLTGLDYAFFDIDDMHGPKRVSSIGASSSLNYFLCPQAIASRLSLG